MQALVRVKKEFKDVKSNNDNSGIAASLVDNNFAHWRASITGPSDTPYEGGEFQVDVQIPDRYPFEPPKMRFLTKVWHPNVSSANGAICLDVLKSAWSPALTIRTTLLSLQALLCDPNPSDPQDAVVARQYLKSKKQFEQKAAQWTQQYAKQANQSELDAKVRQLTVMGFEEQAVHDALERADWNVERAANFLMGIG